MPAKAGDMEHIAAGRVGLQNLNQPNEQAKAERWIRLVEAGSGLLRA